MVKNEEIFLLIIGAFISGLVGLFCSLVLEWNRNKNEQRNISKAFLLDIENIEKKISPIIAAYKSIGVIAGHPMLLQVIITIIKRGNPDYYLSKDLPLYPKNGAYYVFQTEMMKLDFKTVDKLNEFYKKIIYADNRLQKYYDVSSTNQEAKEQYELQGDFFDALTEADSEMIELEEILGANVF
jgi:hypothetical protein